MQTLSKILKVSRLMNQTGGFSYDFSNEQRKDNQVYALQNGRSGLKEGVVLEVGIDYYTDPKTGDERIILV